MNSVSSIATGQSNIACRFFLTAHLNLVCLGLIREKQQCSRRKCNINQWKTLYDLIELLLTEKITSDYGVLLHNGEPSIKVSSEYRDFHVGLEVL